MTLHRSASHGGPAPARQAFLRPRAAFGPRRWHRRLGAAALALALGACAAPEAPRPLVVGGLGMVTPVAFAGGSPNFSAAGEFLVGSFALERGDVRAAAQAFRRALAAHPDNLDLRQRVFLLTLASGDYERTPEEAMRLIEADPDADEARLLLALAAIRAGRLEEARAQLDRIPRSGIIGVALPLVDAWTAALEGRPEAALARVEQVRHGPATGVLRAYHRSMLHAHAGDVEPALQTLQEAFAEDDRAPIRIVLALAHLLARAGEVEEARAMLEAQIAAYGDSLALEAALADLEQGRLPANPMATPQAGMADALLGLAEALDQQQASASAIIYARLALFIDPGLAEAALLLGGAFAAQGNHEEALRAYDLVPGEHPLAWEARLRQASALHALGRAEQAFARLEAMAAELPERVDALMTLGDLLRRDELYERAEVAYSRTLERIERLERRHWPLLYTRGIAYERTGRWPEAEADFLYALELEPEQPYVLNYLAYSWVDRGEHLERALPMLERAVELRPNDGFIVDSLGWVHYRLGNYDQAVEYLERAVALEPGDPILNDHLGDAYWRVGRYREARFQWRRALSLDPEEDTIPEIEDKLQHGLPERAAANAPD